MYVNCLLELDENIEVPSLGIRPKVLIRKRTTPIMHEKSLVFLEFANWPMIYGLDVNFIKGISAKGSWILYKMFR